MRYIELKTGEIEALVKFHKNSANNTVRKRSQCLLLSHQRYTITDLAVIFDVNRRTIERWFDSWAESGLDSLPIRPGRYSLYTSFGVKRSIARRYPSYLL